jgi:hypothetical protein
VRREQQLSRGWRKEWPGRVSCCTDTGRLCRVLILFGLIAEKKPAESSVSEKQSYKGNWRLTKWHQADENE